MSEFVERLAACVGAASREGDTEHRDTYLQRLKSRKLVVDEGRGMVRASDQLF